MAIICAAIVSGCALLPRDMLVYQKEAPLLPIEKPNAATVIGIDVGSDIDILGVGNGRDAILVAEHLEQGDALPDMRVNRFSVSNATIYDFMRTAISDNSKLSFSIDSEHGGANVMKRSVTAVNVSGSLESVLDMFSESVGFYWYYKDGVLHITPDRQYITQVPPINELFDSLPPMIKTLGGTDVFLDKTSRTITYRASRPSQRKITSYLQYIRENKQMLVYDAYIWEVILTDGSDTGVQWNKFDWTGGANGASTKIGLAGGTSIADAKGIGFSAVYTGTHVALDVLASFLKTQGTLRSVSQPKIAMISGGSATFRNGTTTNYVSQVGTTTANNATSTTVQTAQVLSGLDMSLAGDYSDGTIFTDIRLSVNDLQKFNNFTALGTQLSLPQTANREIKTKVRARPGDTILLAGINYEKGSQDVAGLPGGGDLVALATSNLRSLQRSELVIIMKPRVIRFVNDTTKSKSDQPEKAKGDHS